MLQTYKRQPVVFVRGEGTRLFDENGRAYLDFISGIGVCVLGHAHPGLAAVIADQAKTLIHTSNLYYHPLQGQLAATAGVDVGAAARVLLQQRHRGGRSVPEVRAPLLVLEGRSRTARSTSRSSTASRDARWVRCR